MKFDYNKYWGKELESDKQRRLTREYNKQNMFKVYIPDKEYGDFYTWINVIKHYVDIKYYSWDWWNQPYISGSVYQVEPSFFEALIEERANYKEYLVAKFYYNVDKKTAEITPKHVPVNKNLPILPKADDIPINFGKWCNNASYQLNKDIVMIESKYHQLTHSYVRSLGRRLNDGNRLNNEDLSNLIFKTDPVYKTILDYKPLWNLHCRGIDKEFEIQGQVKNANNSNQTTEISYESLEYERRYNDALFYFDGVEKLPSRTSSDKTFYTMFIPYMIRNYIGKKDNTHRLKKITLFLYEELGYYSPSLDKEGYYMKLYDRDHYKGEEGIRLRKEVKEWLNSNR